MKKWILAIIAVVLVAVVSTCIILLSKNPQKMNNDNDISIENPIEPTNPDEPVEPTKPSEPEEEPPIEIVTKAIPFTFDNGQLTGYTGIDEEITLPTSYSLGGYTTETITFADVWELYEWYHKQGFEWKNEVITVKLANGSDYTIYNMSNIMPELENIDDAFPLTYSREVQVFVEGTDYQITSIGANAFSQSNVRSIIIPNGYNEIGNNAFES